MDNTRKRNIKYVQGETPTCLLVNKAQFWKLECIHEETAYYEVELSKVKIRVDLPIQLGYMILQYAKLRMLELYYDFMDVYIDRSQFELMETDNDSIYTSFSGSCLSDVIKPSMKEKYQHGLTGFCNRQDVEADNTVHWFPIICCYMHAKYDKRTPGLFKLEFEGDEMIGLCSKSYIVSNPEESREENRVKLSCKGVNKNTIVNPLDMFRSVPQTRRSKSSINMGFRPKNNTIFTYRQEKIDWNYLYIKRADGIHTDPLDITLCTVAKEEEEEHQRREEKQLTNQFDQFMLKLAIN
ncbi:Hypothetical predicted protein [Mytilus galloprovincialis]|uniref:Uncharacterized protein n=1 Tax=Mytilus galloprovincialis TaxID=29158 RepID=A0A8B6DEG0_MYTGA|nr:Hypothetical predicted protein [Mytilus galloprovincialis]